MTYEKSVPDTPIGLVYAGYHFHVERDNKYLHGGRKQHVAKVGSQSVK